MELRRPGLSGNGSPDRSQAASVSGLMMDKYSSFRFAAGATCMAHEEVGSNWMHG